MGVGGIYVVQYIYMSESSRLPLPPFVVSLRGCCIYLFSFLVITSSKRFHVGTDFDFAVDGDFCYESLCSSVKVSLVDRYCLGGVWGWAGGPHSTMLLELIFVLFNTFVKWRSR